MLKITNFDKQKILGAATSVASGGMSNGIYLIFWKLLGMNPILAAVLALQLIGGLLAYSFDIVFAKESFNGTKIPYSDILYRLSYLGNSFFSEMIIRFVVALIIMSIVYFFVYKALLKTARRYNITFKYNEAFYAMGLSVALYFLFNHILLFDYVYNELDRSIEVDLTVVGTMLLCLIAYCIHISNEER